METRKKDSFPHEAHTLWGRQAGGKTSKYIWPSQVLKRTSRDCSWGASDEEVTSEEDLSWLARGEEAGAGAGTD